MIILKLVCLEYLKRFCVKLKYSGSKRGDYVYLYFNLDFGLSATSNDLCTAMIKYLISPTTSD